MKPSSMPARYTLFARLALGAFVIAAPVWLVACLEDDPAAPESRVVRAARGGKGGGGGGNGAGLSVDDAQPSKVPQGVTLDLRVFGSGFEDGSVVNLLIDGNTTKKIKTNSTAFVSDTELIANITVAADADLTFYDVRVTSSGKKKGVGIDLVEVIPGPEATLLTCTVVGGACDPSTPSGVYEDGKGTYFPADGRGGDVQFASNGNLRVNPQCDSGREILLVLPASTDWDLSGPPSTCNAKRGGFVRLQIPGLLGAEDGPIGEPPEPPNYSPSVFFFFVVGGDAKFPDSYNVIWTDAHVQVLERRDDDGTPFKWRVTGSQAELYLRPGDQDGQPQASGTVDLDLIVTLRE